jgi:hypothetical protein
MISKKTVVDIIFYREQVGIEETREILENLSAPLKTGI